MKEEKRKETKEHKKEIIVLDAGIIDDGPQWACCFYAYFPIRGT